MPGQDRGVHVKVRQLAARLSYFYVAGPESYAQCGA